ncbi:putative Dynein heavy chain 6; axonemal [Paratrimastix pyriformis]|uniref:Dynein heavy chain 6 n=1 Tax=Paratrimastix pyriformis TaxID=342808 RepID=A0ABQ8UQE6_9EUKA|nr:putative Dynein heavy chain 6; axonemal [Paratrimastix pyriformis]
MAVMTECFGVDHPPSPGELIFTDIPEHHGDQRVYREVRSTEALSSILHEHLEDYNMSCPRRMDLVFFDDAVMHIARIARIIRQPRGNGLLIGVGGSGRQSLTMLAAHIAECRMTSVEISKITTALLSAGAKMMPTVFMLTDTQIVKEQFLEDINNLLNVGEVPNLWKPDEIDAILEQVRPAAKQAGKGLGRDEVMAYFVSLTRARLHVILCMSPIGATLRNRLRQYPSLVNCCALDWFDPWPTDALLQVARRRLVDMHTINDAMRDQIAQVFVHIHTSVKDAAEQFYQQLRRRTYVTPTSYLEHDLDAALPEYRRAMRAVEALDRDSLTEVRSFKNPPYLVTYVLEAVCVLFREKPSWDNAKKLMSGDFLKTLKTFDKVSTAARALCEWIRALVTFTDKTAEIEPKRRRAEEAKAELEVQMTALKAKQAELQAVVDKLGELKARYDASVARKETLEKSMAATKLKLERAERLLQGLSGEASRWTETVAQLAQERASVVGDVLLASGYIAYLGPFTNEYRKELAARWVNKCKELGVPVLADEKEPFSLERVLGDPVQVRQWRVCGLPSDPLSTVNAIIATRSRRWPLGIDPQGQANRWIKNLERPNRLMVTKQHETTLSQSLENTIRNGIPLLLENIGETIEPVVSPVLNKQITKAGPRLLIRLGDQDVDYSADFKLYLTSKLPNPHYVPEICIRATIINFTVTPSGLEEQLLAEVVRIERPELEEERDKLIVQMAKDADDLERCEDDILNHLASVTGSILENETVIKALDNARVVSTATKARVEQAQKTNQMITQAREQYRAVAARGSVLYFVVADLSLVDPMYQYSLPFFTGLFARCVRESRASADPNVEAHVATLIEKLTRVIYGNVCRGLFERDKQLFSLLIDVMISRAAGIVSFPEWRLFLSGPPEISPPGGVSEEHTAPDWLTPAQWRAFCALDDLRRGDPTSSSTYGVSSLPHLALRLGWGVICIALCVLQPMQADPRAAACTGHGHDPWADHHLSLTHEQQLALAMIPGRPFEGLVDSLTGLDTPAWRQWLLQEAPEACALPGKWATSSFFGQILSASIPLTIQPSHPPPQHSTHSPSIPFSLPDQTRHHHTFTFPSPSFPRGGGNQLSAFQRLLLVRLVREERLTFASARLVHDDLGAFFADPPQMDLKASFADSSPATPIIFVLSSGTDPMSYLRQLASDMGFTDRMKLKSLGKGQGEDAERLIKAARKEGQWVWSVA